MRIIVIEFMSLDGVVQAPGGPEEDTDRGFAHGGWSMPYFDPEAMGGFYGETMSSVDAMLFGRRTWEVSAAAWPERAGDPFADRMNSIPKYVASRTLRESDLRWSGSVLLPTNGADGALDAISTLHEREGGEVLVMGSASLAEQLAEHDLVDEYRLMIEPILLGGGKGIFPTTGGTRPLELVSATTAPTGVLVCTYARAR